MAAPLPEQTAVCVTAHLDALESLLDNHHKDHSGLPVGERTLLMKELKRLREHLLRKNFRCPVFGITKAGKSTLLNAMLGHEILASSNVPMTRATLDLVHNPRLDLPELNSPEIHLQGSQAIKAYLASQTVPNSSEDSRYLEVAMPFLSHLEQRDFAFTLVDTPGVTEAGGAALSRSTLNQISSADAAILVMNSQDLHTLGEQAFLKQVAHKRPDLFLRLNRTFFFVVSKVDIRNRNSTPFFQIAQIIGDQIRDSLPDSIVLANPRFLPVKGELAMLARIAPKPEAGVAVRLGYTRALFGAREQRPRSATSLHGYAAGSIKSSGIQGLELALQTLAASMPQIRLQTIGMRLHHLVNRALRMAQVHHAADLSTALHSMKERIRHETPTFPARS